jgi:hypothetical protein
MAFNRALLGSLGAFGSIFEKEKGDEKLNVEEQMFYNFLLYKLMIAALSTFFSRYLRQR